MVKLISFLVCSLLSVSYASGRTFISGRQTATTGDKKCGSLMCISATVNGSSVQYVLSSTGKRTPGWMGMGFGRQMGNTPMVIIWTNSDGTVTLSQRTANGHTMPTLDSNPPRAASLLQSATSATGSTASYAYTIPANSDTKQYVIYAFGPTAPSSSAADASIEEHLDFGTVQLDLAKTVSTSTSSGSASSPTGGSSSGSGPTDDIPLQPYERLIVAHAIFCTVGFLLLLPAGALLARYFRTFTPKWFIGHWVAQLAFAGIAIVIGFALGVQAVSTAGSDHLSDRHMKLGVGLFVLYIAQSGLGAIIHWIKPKRNTGRPIQNYVHAIVGLLIIGASMYQVHNGYKNEWLKATAQEPFSKGIDILFWVWIAAIIALYAIGLYFLPKQLKQEKTNQGEKRLPNEYEEMEHFEERQYRDRD
ncbi:hypothetical protein Hypma_002605 [Hypsizygus marmoreus]|uniref:Cytochrome b561 domain-containing protein n=1 Tax=Hypsizygus marmoreus TaxID=39966 RepID=A0A369J6H5_HYPMA|nr:hypothetical protein Hypma_002605 [Hypsizygus marmoreus]